MVVSSLVVGTVLASILAYVVFVRASSVKEYDGEPVHIQSNIPLIGHLLGLIKYGTGYYTTTSLKTSEAIYTLDIFNTKLYVINDVSLFPTIQRTSKTLSFQPFQRVFAKQVGGCPEAKLDIYNEGYSKAFAKQVRASLQPGPDLDEMNRVAAEVLSEQFRSFSTSPTGKDLYSWVQYCFTMASTRALYGPENPYSDESAYKAFWTFEKQGKILLAGPLAQVLARRALAARDMLFKCFQGYFGANSHHSSSSWVQTARDLKEEHGFEPQEVARNEVAFGIVVLANTVPTAFWALYDVLSRASSVQRVRGEIKSAVEVEDTGKRLILDVSALKSCKFLISSFQETQRTRHIHASIRKVVDDTTITHQSGRKYRLEREQFVQMPSAPIHASTRIWGPDATAFDPERFLTERKYNNTAKSSDSDESPYYFLPWGLAPHLCPARQFASTEILMFIAMVVFMLEVEPVDKGEEAWSDGMEPDTSRLAALLPPVSDLEVNVRTRKQFEGYKWTVEVGDSMKKVPLASG